MRLRLMSFNIYCGGQKLGQPLSRTADVVRAGRADVCVLQEQSGSAPALAEMLGMQLRVREGVGILSRFPIVDECDWRVTLSTEAGLLHVAGVHLTAYPYGPYDLRDDPALAPPALVATAEDTRGAEVAHLLQTLEAQLASGEPVFLAGDLNEPSHRDWPDVDWPTSMAIERAGFVDSVRAVHPDPSQHPFHTWTPAPGEHEIHDRIDFVHHAGPVRATAAEMIGEDVVSPFPSDHRAIVVEFELD